MPINAGALVEPAIAEAGVHPHHQIILFAIPEKIAHVETKWSVAVIVAPDEVPVQKYQRAAERAVKLNRDSPSVVFLGNIERTPVPAHTRLRIPSSQRFVPMGLLFVIVHERQFHCPVVRQIERPPFRVVKFLRGELEFAALREISLSHAESQIAQRIVGVSLKKLPAKVEQQTLARSHRGGRFRRRNARIVSQQRMGAAN